MKGLIEWFADNSVAANLLMAAILIGGYVGLEHVNKEVFPTSVQKIININMNYLGAGPREVEQQIIVRIEEAIADLPGIFQIRSTASQGNGSVQVEVIEGYDVKAVLNDIKVRVDAINTFPSGIERPVIAQQIFRTQLMFFTLYGNADPHLMKAMAQQISDDMALLDGISQVTYRGAKPDELKIEISEYAFRQYGLTFDLIAQAIRQSSLNLPAGTIKTKMGQVQVQIRRQAYDAEDFAGITLLSYPDGIQLKLGAIAEIKDGFSEQDLEVSYNKQNAIDFQVFISDNPDLFGGTENARNYINELKDKLPDNMKVDINYEMKELFDSRRVLLTDNASSGLLLVFVILTLVLRPLLAIWVCVGIAAAFAGAMWMLPVVDVSINMLSMFAFLMVLGIVVDDGIIVGESIYSAQQKGITGVKASIEGTERVFKPVILAVVSTIIFFMPMIDVPMEVEPYTLSIFYVITFCLLFSLVECLFILPAHLAHLKPERKNHAAMLKWNYQMRAWLSQKLQIFAATTYRNSLGCMLKNSGATIVGFTIAFFLSLSVYIGGWINTSFFPNVPQSFINVNVTLPKDTVFSEAQRIANHIENVAHEMKEDQYLLDQNNGDSFITEIKKTASDANANVFIGLALSKQRKVSAKAITKRLKELIGPIPEAKSYSLAFSLGGDAHDIKLNLNVGANDLMTQQKVVEEVKATLAGYEGISNVRSSMEPERIEVELSLKPYAETLDITLNDIARQIRQGFYGEEIQRIPRGKEDVRVMLRYPQEQRRRLDLLEDMRVRTQDSIEIPLTEVAEINLVPGYNQIQRVDRKRNISVTADVRDGYDAQKITDEMLLNHLKIWQRKYIGFDLSTDGNLRAQARFGDAITQNFMMAVLAVYALMAIAFRSYWESMLILSAVPFGFMGAIIGHLFLGLDISMMSFFGFLACAGVVVNDNLVLLDRINQIRETGVGAFDAVTQAGQERFRAIILTSVTTFVGLMPILFETSEQSQFLLPMVVSLSFGILFATAVTLILVPCLYWQGDKVATWFNR